MKKNSILKEKTQKTSVPQIFFNDIYIGGNDDLQAAIQDEEKWKNLIVILETNFYHDDDVYIPREEDKISDTDKCI